MIDLLTKLGFHAGIGFLLGIGLVAWISPLTTGGVLLLMTIAVIAAVVAGKLVETLRNRRPEGD